MRRRTRVKDNFEGSNYSLTDSETSPNDEWTCDYAGGGTVEVKSDNVRTSKIMRICPAVSVPDTTGNTRAAKIDSAVDMYDFECVFDMKTFAQTKSGATQNNWEVAWFMWHYTDDHHHYYMLIQKNGGVEVGKKDFPSFIEQQVFLSTTNDTSPTFSMGQWFNVRVRQKGYAIKVWVDDILRADFTDAQGVGTLNGSPNPDPPSSNMLHGKFSFYGEDADAYYDNFAARAL